MTVAGFVIVAGFLIVIVSYSTGSVFNRLMAADSRSNRARKLFGLHAVTTLLSTLPGVPLKASVTDGFVRQEASCTTGRMVYVLPGPSQPH